MDIIQSFIYTVGRGHLSLYEQRILLKIIEHAQVVIKGRLVKTMLFRVNHDLDNVRIDIPARYILSDGSKHYEDVKNAARSLMAKTMEFYDSDTKGWYATPLIYNVSYVQGSGLLSFFVSKMLFDVALDFSKGFCKYNLEVALSLPSPYAIRLYALMNTQSHPITIEIGELKKMLGAAEKYAQTRDFLKKCIDPAQKALNEVKCNSFSYIRNFKGNKVTSITLAPVRRGSYTADELAARLPVSDLVSKEMTIILISCLGFTTKELAAHKVLLHDFQKLPYCRDVLYKIEQRARKKNKGKGYVIAALRDEVAAFNSIQHSTK